MPENLTCRRGQIRRYASFRLRDRVNPANILTADETRGEVSDLSTDVYTIYF
jgi:hypothetical protein